MRVIDLAKNIKNPRTTVLSYGLSRAGKTRWAASWPKALFLSDATESGWETIRNMDQNVFYEPQRPPVVWAIERVSDMMQAIKDVEPLVKRGEVQTIVVDSLTFYSDMFFNWADSATNGNRMDQRQLYLKLAQHLKDMRIQIHSLNTNVVWTALAKPPGEETPIGGPMISGQNAQKFAAGCDYVFYHRCFQSSPTGPQQYEIRTRTWQSFSAGGRDEGLLPDPLGYIGVADEREVFVPDCTYRTMAEALGLTPPVYVPPPAPAPPITTTTAAIPNGTAAGKKPTVAPNRPLPPR